jgi:site-specific recombinase XerD
MRPQRQPKKSSSPTVASSSVVAGARVRRQSEAREQLVVPYRPARRQRGTPQGYPDPDVGAFAEYLALQRRRSPHTVRAYVSDVEQFGRFVDDRHSIAAQPSFRGPFIGLRTATPSHVRRWIMQLMDPRALPERRKRRQFLESNRSIARKLAALREFGRHLRKAGIRADDMTLDVDGPEVRNSEPDPFTDTELRELLAAPVPYRKEWQMRRDRALLELMYGAGLRASELVGINDSDVNHDLRFVRVRGKGSKLRNAPFTKAAAAALSAYLAVRPQCETNALFVSWKRRRLSVSGFERIFKMYADVAGIKGARAHRLRHSFGTGMAEAGADSILLRDLMGHESTQTTAGYVKVSIRRKTDAITLHPRDRWD